ncbi:efflux RND transporter periplasmic adaptor subunit [Labrys wisconsinensis]|uniref:RND family efflux transporter MFP subunit n=1 Tax=Labrys wisconsinensis TaxID=425677 RepID=A0ABU0IZR4_9HYPH|nr:efflux RND transporter periplasmic adaptor subunit [Labrys wisconsinensis]MDQ0467512.1 RND family efflux transporter MFP subunit [Labrys wisconsinensis]
MTVRISRASARLHAAALAALLATTVGAGAQMGPLPVTVAKPVSRKVTETADFTGRFQAWPSVQITSRVTGYLDKATFVEGALVKEGDVLFTIDPRPFQAAVDQATAQVKVAQTRLDLARTNLARSEELKRTGNVTDATLQSNQQAFLEGQASIEAANAALASARLDLEFSQIRAPITGKIGRKLVSPGNLVIANSTSPLTTIVAVDPIRFYFDIDEASYLAYMRANQNRANGEEASFARLALPDEKTFSHTGKLDYIDPQVDNATGTVTARAEVPNTDGFLTPGLFGRVRINITPSYEALVVPDVAVGSSDQGNYVLTAGADGTIAVKPVVTGPKFGTFRVIKRGLAASDDVVINGLMRAAPGGKAVPERTELKVPEDLAAAMAPAPAVVQ